MKNIAGQALIEGIMMKSESKKAITIRKNDGETETLVKDVKKNPFAKIPIIRGIYQLISSLIEGNQDIAYSASFFEDEDDDEDTKISEFLKKYLGINPEKALAVCSFVIALIIALFLFSVLPAYVAKFTGEKSNLAFSAIEGLVKIIIFVTYIYVISKISDIHRIFMYHGAEHKTIFAYEKGLSLDVENIKKMPRLHPRCGTNFITIVLILSIFINSFIQIDNIMLRIVWKILLLPLVTGISYEIIKFSAKKDNFITKILVFPGMMLQKITTQEPDEEQIEVAIIAVNKVLQV